jgi:hypothetical protein
MSRVPKEKKKDAYLTDAASADLIAVGGDESVNVAIRVRPFNSRELALHREKTPDEFIRSVVEMPKGVQGHVRMMQRSDDGEYTELEKFEFTKSFWSIPQEQQPSKYLPIQQEDVYGSVGRVVLTNALMGFNCCVFAYGQTGSGKTHTMMGNCTVEGDHFAGDPGIIPRMCQDLFQKAEEKKAEMEEEEPRLKVRFEIKLSALEIYNEQVKDLFWKQTPGRTKGTVLKVRVGGPDGAYVDQLTVVKPTTWQECLGFIKVGVMERTVAATLMNDESSRSHSVFQIGIKRVDSMGPPVDDPAKRFDKPVETFLESKINLVDLAGSERNKKSGVTGQQLKEAAGINLSLSTLKKVIDALVDNSMQKNKKKHVLIPYRESTLTLLLSHSLGGNSKTTMISCVSPHYDNVEETVLTLRYANRAKGIVNNVKVNEDNSQRTAALLKAQVEELERKMAEGPQTYTEEELNKLREQLEAGERARAEQEKAQRDAEAKAKVDALQLKTQQDARYAALFYNSFKRCLLERQREKRARALGLIEAELEGASAKKETVTNAITRREKSALNNQFTVDELQRRGDLWKIKSARNQAMTKQLAVDVERSRQKAKDTLMARFGSVWVRNSKERRLREANVEERAARQREHQQQLQNVTREAKKQLELLVSRYADREQAQRERHAVLERGCAHAAAQLEKAEQQLYTAKFQLERSGNDHVKREADKEAAWARRFNDMKNMYAEKLALLEARHAQDEQEHNEMLESTKRHALLEQAEAIVGLEDKLEKLDQDGHRRLKTVAEDTETECEDLVAATMENGTNATRKLKEQFAADSALLGARIATRVAELAVKQRDLESQCRHALDIEDLGRRVEGALQRSAKTGPSSYLMYRRELGAFVQRFEQAHFELHHVSTTMKKTVPAMPNARA